MPSFLNFALSRIGQPIIVRYLLRFLYDDMILLMVSNP